MTDADRIAALERECATLKTSLKREARDITLLKGALERIERFARHALEQLAKS